MVGGGGRGRGGGEGGGRKWGDTLIGALPRRHTTVKIKSINPKT
jgi:hypothetical protein